MSDNNFRFPAEHHLFRKINKRQLSNSLRELKISTGLEDFCSNDYLGLARSAELKKRIQEVDEKNPMPLGSTGSRLLSGNSAFAEQVEKELSVFLKSESAVLYSSGYDANAGVFSCIAGKEDVVLYDETIHASIHDGLSMSFASSYKFRHNDLAHLEEKLALFSGKNSYVAVESVYSMDGDFAPLAGLVKLCDQYNANLIVDEAHATGVFGEKGEGRVVELGLQDSVFLRVHTFGKALGSHGAAVACTALTKTFLINYSRPFIYSTALPFHSLASIQCAVAAVQEMHEERKQLRELILYFKSLVTERKIISFLPSDSPVQSVVLGGNNPVKAASAALQEAGFDIRPILSPTVQTGTERLRICLHVFNTREQVEKILLILEGRLNDKNAIFADSR